MSDGEIMGIWAVFQIGLLIWWMWMSSDTYGSLELGSEPKR